MVFNFVLSDVFIHFTEDQDIHIKWHNLLEFQFQLNNNNNKKTEMSIKNIFSNS